jgi:amino acid permease
VVEQFGWQSCTLPAEPMGGNLGRFESVGADFASVLGVVVLSFALVLAIPSVAVQAEVLWSLLLALVGFVLTVWLIPVFSQMHRDQGNLYGKDLGKRLDPARRDVLV